MGVFSKYITRNPQKIGEMRDMGINLNDFAPARESRDSLFSGIAKAVRRNIPVQQTGGMENLYLDETFATQEDLLGRARPDMPVANLIIPGYNEEMDIVDTGKIRIRDYLKDFAGQAGEGIVNTLAGQDRRSAFARAGLGSLLFGFNPITALLGAFIGSKAPDIYSSLQGKNINPLSFIREKRAERQRERMEKAAAFEREQALRQIDQAGTGFDDYDSGQGAGMGFGGGRTDPTDKS